MDTNEYNLQVKSYYSKLTNLTNEAENIVQKFIKLMQFKVVEWAAKFVEDTAKKQSNVTKSLDINGIRSLKAEMPDVINQLPGILETVFNLDANWSHRVHKPSLKNQKAKIEDLIDEYNKTDLEQKEFYKLFSGVKRYPHNIPMHLKSAYAVAQEPVLDLLRKFSYQPVVHETDASGEIDNHFPIEAKTILGEYCDNYRKRHAVFYEMSRIQKIKEIQEAEAIWNEA